MTGDPTVSPSREAAEDTGDGIWAAIDAVLADCAVEAYPPKPVTPHEVVQDALLKEQDDDERDVVRAAILRTRPVHR